MESEREREGERDREGEGEGGGGERVLFIRSRLTKNVNHYLPYYLQLS